MKLINKNNNIHTVFGMSKKLLATIVFIALSFTIVAQVGIGTTTPDASAMLDVVSTNKGLLFPRVANTGAIAAPANGLIVYDISEKCLRSYQNGSWSVCYGTASQIASLACATQTTEGKLIDTRAANNVFFTINYTGGNGGVYAGEIVNSTLISGLTATLVSGTLAVGAGSVTYSVAGIPEGDGTTRFAINLGGKVCTVNLEVDCKPLTSPTTEVVEITSATGRVWMDRNLGATQAATSQTDAAAYGSLYQWGRNTDGHEVRTSCLSEDGSVAAGNEGYKFIKTPYLPNNAASDWLSPVDDTRWNAGTEDNPIKNEANDPCPAGYRIPTKKEWAEEFDTWVPQNGGGAFASLKLSRSGYRFNDTGSFGRVGISGHYWTSSSVENSSNVENVGFTASGVIKNTNTVRGDGMTVRCIKEL